MPSAGRGRWPAANALDPISASEIGFLSQALSVLDNNAKAYLNMLPAVTLATQKVLERGNAEVAKITDAFTKATEDRTRANVAATEAESIRTRSQEALNSFRAALDEDRKTSASSAQAAFSEFQKALSTERDRYLAQATGILLEIKDLRSRSETLASDRSIDEKVKMLLTDERVRKAIEQSLTHLNDDVASVRALASKTAADLMTLTDTLASTARESSARIQQCAQSLTDLRSHMEASEFQQRQDLASAVTRLEATDSMLLDAVTWLNQKTRGIGAVLRDFANLGNIKDSAAGWFPWKDDRSFWK